jgi:zinc protease
MLSSRSIAAALLLAGIAAGQPAPKIEFEKYTLPNGLQVILHVDRKLPMVHVNLWYHVGSANERPGRSGFTHLFEHIMFQGSKNADKFIVVAEPMGANDTNGTTSFDRTNYFATVPSGNLETLLWLEADHPATLPEGITQQKLDNQRDVVKNERRQGLENEPYGWWFMLVCHNLYPQRHPYAHDVIGSHEDLTAASMDDVKDFFRTYYTPNNLFLTIAGDFDPAEAKKFVAKYFGTIPPSPPLDRPVRWIPKLDGPRVVDVSDRVPQERVYMAFQSPPFFEAGDADLDILSVILSDGLSARLNRALVYDRQLCSDTGAFQFSGSLGGMFIVQATARPNVSIVRDREADSRRDCAGGEGRRQRLGTRPGESEMGVPVYLRARTDRGVRGKGRPVEPVQHVPGRPEHVRKGLGAASRSDERQPAEGRGAVDRYGQ